MSEHDDELTLDARTRAVIEGLPPDDRERLETLITNAAAHQRQMLQQALEEAVHLIPGPFRKRVRRLFLG